MGSSMSYNHNGQLHDICYIYIYIAQNAILPGSKSDTLRWQPQRIREADQGRRDPCTKSGPLHLWFGFSVRWLFHGLFQFSKNRIAHSWYQNLNWRSLVGRSLTSTWRSLVGPVSLLHMAKSDCAILSSTWRSLVGHSLGKIWLGRSLLHMEKSGWAISLLHMVKSGWAILSPPHDEVWLGALSPPHGEIWLGRSLSSTWRNLVGPFSPPHGEV